MERIKKITSTCGFTIHPDKTHTYYAKDGRRIITGVSVADDLKPTRKAKRKLRAAAHQAKTNPEAISSAKGLHNWCQLRMPKKPQVFSLSTHENIVDEVQSVCKVWNLSISKKDLKNMPNKGEDIKLDNNCIITGDPVMMLGMSTYTTGWTSCMRQPYGQYRKGSIFWAFLKGTRIAALLDNTTDTHGGVERPRMKARALIHELRNGLLVYDRVYGPSSEQEVLVRELEKNGVVSVIHAKKVHAGEKVVGHAPIKYKPYFDNMRSTTAKAVTGRWKGKQVRIVHL